MGLQALAVALRREADQQFQRIFFLRHNLQYRVAPAKDLILGPAADGFDTGDFTADIDDNRIIFSSVSDPGLCGVMTF
ncbi:MAG: hypothetical protein PVF09_02910 [Desulfobacterales bacterium]|jgi:hypothetical protein